MKDKDETENLGRCPYCGKEQTKVPLPKSHPDYQKSDHSGLKQYLCQNQACGKIYRS